MGSIISFVESIPPAFYGIIIGSLLTLIGVALTNISNTKRLRLQHEHEQKLESKARDLNLRRDVYMAAMEAISAGLVAVSRYSDFSVSSDELMKSYTDHSPAIGKISIVGNSQVIKAVATFNLDLTGAFMRLTVRREKYSAILERNMSLTKEIKQLRERIDHLSDQKEEGLSVKLDQRRLSQPKSDRESLDKYLNALRTEHADLNKQIMPLQIDLIRESIKEVAALDQLLVPLIGLMRAELGLSFDEAYYAQILKEGYERQKGFLAAIFHDYQQQEEGTAG